jgi:hypothetical protein
MYQGMGSTDCSPNEDQQDHQDYQEAANIKRKIS